MSWSDGIDVSDGRERRERREVDALSKRLRRVEQQLDEIHWNARLARIDRLFKEQRQLGFVLWMTLLIPLVWMWIRG